MKKQRYSHISYVGSGMHPHSTDPDVVLNNNQQFGLFSSEPHSFSHCMPIIRLPSNLHAKKHKAKYIMAYFTFRLSTTLFIVEINGLLWIRLSVQLYVTREDIEFVGDKMLSF
jgi:hypothetical protein